MQSHDGSNDTTHNPPPLSYYNTFKEEWDGSVQEEWPSSVIQSPASQLKNRNISVLRQQYNRMKPNTFNR